MVHIRYFAVVIAYHTLNEHQPIYTKLHFTLYHEANNILRIPTLRIKNNNKEKFIFIHACIYVVD